jgi:hypothetical protein
MALSTVTEQTVLSTWALAELRGPAGARAVEMGLMSAQVLDRLRTDADPSLTAAEWTQAHHAIRVKRAPLIGNLFDLGVTWSSAVFEVDDLQGLEIIAIPEWHAKYPTQRLEELAGTRHLSGDAPEFRGFETTLESPIAVCERLDGPCCLVEGYTRVATFLRDSGAGLTTSREMRMLLGVSPRIHEWAGPRGRRWWPRDAL